MRPQTLLPILLGGALGAGGILQGIYWRNTAASGDREKLESDLAGLRDEVELLRRENESLRSLAQGGGELNVPAPLIEFAERVAGLDFRSSPVVHRLAGEELRGRITASIESRYPPNTLDHRQQAWIRMGLLQPDDRFAPQLAITRSLGARSWFDEHSGEAWVTDAFDENSIPDQSSLLRSLVRILLHQHHPPPPGYPGDEPARARRALHHGAALAASNRFMARQAVGIGFTGAMDDGDAARDLLDSLPAYIRGLATFPSQFGLPHAQKLFEDDRLLSALHEPPTTTGAFIEDIAGAEIDPPVPPEQPGEVVLEESAGFLGLRLWLATLDPDAGDVARGWRGDRYQLSARGEDGLDLAWTIRLDSPETADRVLAIARAMAGYLGGADTDPAAGETHTGPDGRRLTARRDDPVTVTFLNLAPE